MTTTHKIILCVCALLFAATLCFIPVTMTLNGHEYDGSRLIIDLGHYDRIRFDILLLWWAGIIGNGAILWALFGWRR